jgi:hypothetical protein
MKKTLPIEDLPCQGLSRKSRNASLSPGNLARSGEDAGENIIAATSACPQARGVAQHKPVACHDSEAYPTESPRDRISEGILAGSWEFTHASVRHYEISDYTDFQVKIDKKDSSS